jgi:hypothetical protein
MEVAPSQILDSPELNLQESSMQLDESRASLKLGFEDGTSSLLMPDQRSPVHQQQSARDFESSMMSDSSNG